jgi:hypothetical protein
MHHDTSLDEIVRLGAPPAPGGPRPVRMTNSIELNTEVNYAGGTWGQPASCIFIQPIESAPLECESLALTTHNTPFSAFCC